MNKELKSHNAAVEQMFQQIKPIIEGQEASVALETLLITLAACGGQLDMTPEHFKAFVIVQLDRLMLVDAKPEGTA
jgi:hypothetical protein